MNDNVKKNIFICHTPLHIIISKRIIDLENLDRYSLIYLVDNMSEKNKYYYSLFEPNDKGSLIFLKENNLFDFLRLTYQAKSMWRRALQGAIYSGNIKTFYSRFIIWFLKPKRIYSFDDGIGNIKMDGHGYKRSYFQDLNERWHSRLFFNIVDRAFLYRNLVMRINRHYTIYDHANVYDNTLYIPIMPVYEGSDDKKEKMNILLSNALALEKYMSKQEEDLFYGKIIESFNIDLVIRHPRNEDYHPPTGCKVSESLLIAEHQIFNLSKTYDLFVVSPFYSSVLVNIPNSVRKVNVVSNVSKKDSPELKLFYDNLGIKTYVIEDYNSHLDSTNN